MNESPTKEEIPPVKTSPRNIRYLAFEGGGGRGVAYIGVLEALQELLGGGPGAELPIIRRGEKNQIRGISGASAGAISALFVSLGFSAAEIKEKITQARFADKLDLPRPGNRVMVRGNGNTEVQTDGKSWKAILKAWLTTALPLRTLVELSVTDPAFAPFRKRLSMGFNEYMQSLVLDFGLFDGHIFFEFFAQVIDSVLAKLPTKLPWNGRTLPFKDFYKLTSQTKENGIDLVISGTNVSQQRSYYFSSKETPDFPVAAAVLLSMAIPGVFKPIWIDANVRTNDETQRKRYKGLWVDGGVVNNLPIHAFDEVVEVPYSPAASGFVRTINPLMLGFQLVPGLPGTMPSDVKHPRDVGFFDFLGNVMGTLLYPGSGGQIRSREEADHVIDLYTGDLQTIDFSPSSDKSDPVIETAYCQVMNYYAAYLKKIGARPLKHNCIGALM